MDLYKRRRQFVPKRTSELVALMAISTTLFLFLHTRDLNTRLKEMEVKLQPDDTAFNQLSLRGDSGFETINRNDIQEMERNLRITGEVHSTIKPDIIIFKSNCDNLNARKTILNIEVRRRVAMSTLHPYLLNNTRNAQQNIVFFNRVPKVGSQTFMELLRRLSIRNTFGFHRDRVQRVETIRLAPVDQAELAAAVTALEQPSVYIKHVCFTNFTMYGMPEPIYVNLVRDPVERVISWYYYVRAPWYYVERKQVFPDLPLPDPGWLRKDFETCVLSGDRECQYIEGETHEGIGDHRRQSLFFCGHNEACTPFNTVGALERAKYAVEKHYAVVGVLEDLNSTLTVLEKYIPKFFSGATQVFWDEVDRFNKINRNLFKPPVSEEIKEIVRRNFTREIEFYQFCRQRLHKQLLALKTNK